MPVTFITLAVFYKDLLTDSQKRSLLMIDFYKEAKSNLLLCFVIVITIFEVLENA